MSMSENGALGNDILTGMEHPPLGKVMAVGIVTEIGLLVTDTEYLANAV